MVEKRKGRGKHALKGASDCEDSGDSEDFRNKRSKTKSHRKSSRRNRGEDGSNGQGSLDEDNEESRGKDEMHRFQKRRKKDERKLSKIKKKRFRAQDQLDMTGSGDCDSETSEYEDEGQQHKHRRKRREREKNDRKKKKRERKKEEKRSKRHSKARRGKIRNNKHYGSDGASSSESTSQSEMPDSDSENLSSPPEVAMDILKKFPAIALDLQQLLKMIDDGQAVDITGLPDKLLVTSLRNLFQSLHLYQAQNGMFLLPTGAHRKTMDLLGPVISSYLDRPSIDVDDSGHDHCQKRPEAATHEEKEVLGLERKVEGLVENLSNRDLCCPIESKRRVMGPAMPSAEMLAAAARLTDAGSALREAEEELELEPLIGPPPPAVVAEAETANEAERFEEVTRILAPDICNAYEVLGLKPSASADIIKKRYWKLSLMVHPDKCSHPQAHQAFTSLNQAVKELQDPTKRAIIDQKIEDAAAREEYEAELKAQREAAQWRRLRGEALPGDDVLLGQGLKPPARDEWMTVLPPERQAGAPSMHSTFFSKSEKTGRGDTSVWTDTPLEKAQKAKIQYLEAYKQAALTGAKEDIAPVERNQTKKVADLMDKFDKTKRSKSLVEKHQLDLSDKSQKRKRLQKQEEEWSSKHPWKPWDREKDLASGGQSLKWDAGSTAQGLASRFADSKLERNFL